MQILAGHVSPDTAYVVSDYPYGFRLRCQIRYWLEYRKAHGFRFASQTTNPKRGNVWNAARFSTYHRFGAAMFLDDAGHVQYSGLTEYTDGAEASAWLATYGAGVPEEHRNVTEAWVRAKVAYDAQRAAGVGMRQAAAVATVAAAIVPAAQESQS